MDRLREYCQKELANQNFDSLALSVIDFRSQTFETLEFYQNQEISHERVFDLASLTKPLVLGLGFFLLKKEFSPEMLLLLEHRSGLPAWARLDRKTWPEYVQSFSIKESPCVYSDLGPLRLQCELEKRLQGSLEKEASSLWDSEMSFWLDLDSTDDCVETGYRHNRVIKGEVNDDNSYNLSCFTAHTGLFSTISSLSRTLLGSEERLGFVSEVVREISTKPDFRFSLGWDRSQDPETSLSGFHRSQNVFGHLGFTGTSIWIHPEQMKGFVLLTNGTQNFWFEKTGLNKMRRELGTLVWQE